MASRHLCLMAFVATILTVFTTTEAKSATGDRVVAILENDKQKSEYSQLFGGLESKKRQTIAMKKRKICPILSSSWLYLPLST